MNQRATFLTLLAVIAVSIVFGMLLGGKLNAPRVALAAPVRGAPVVLASAATGPEAVTGFADVVERSLPSVVAVSSTQTAGSGDVHERFRRDPLFRWFFGDPGDGDDPRRRRERPRIGLGSGFIVSAEGYVLTNHHVVREAERIEVRLHDGSEFEAELVGEDPAIDLAVIKIDSGDARLTPLPLGDSDGLRVGQWVIAIGNPLQFDHTVTVGVVSAKGRQVEVGATDESLARFIQTDAAINFGNSGGPLMDGAGNVIGINTAISRRDFAEGIGFALPINEARSAMEQIVQSGKVRRGFLGIKLFGEGLSDTAAEYHGLPDSSGALVQEVTPGQAADRAGLEPGDIIRKVDGEVVTDNRDLIRKISSRQPGDRVKLELYRDGKTVSRTARLMDRREGLAEGEPAPDDETSGDAGDPDSSSGFGVTVQNLDRTWRRRLELDERERGVVVVDIEFDSPLADAGIRPGTVIREINDRAIRDVTAWDRVVAELRPGTPMKLGLRDPGGDSRITFVRVPESDD